MLATKFRECQIKVRQVDEGLVDHYFCENKSRCTKPYREKYSATLQPRIFMDSTEENKRLLNNKHYHA